MSTNAIQQADGRIVIERFYAAASIEDVWELWTTAEGIESWWGPEGFRTDVHDLDLRAGGQMRYAMTAVGASQVQFMKRAGMPVTTESRITYTEIVPGASIGYTHLADFIPGVEAYEFGNRVEFRAENGGVRMVLRLDRMHSDEWTQRAVMGWESQLGKLGRVIADRVAG